MTPRILSGLSDIIDRYDGFILDLWGVLHDGCKAYPDTVGTLEALKSAGKKTVLVSNAPRRNTVVIEKLESMGIGRDLYTGIVTSGEVTWGALRTRHGARIFFIGQRDKDSSIYEGTGTTLAQTPEAADLLLVSGVRDFSDTPEQYEDILKRSRAKNLPFICANPDRIVHVGDQLVVCAGTLADRYESMGGAVEWYGKPYPAVYTAAFEVLGGMDKPRVLAVGDSIVTDIAGASGIGIESLLITGGIHRDDLMAAGRVSPEKTKVFFAKAPFIPMGILKGFFL